ncbi:MAG: N-formylglutamate amidohydrolase, partial [Proteobacteria bacterium]|nr:N-formylglutamate amidohydrolase [Pseudomonadota bacterium]
VVCIHSFTAEMDGFSRPWHMSFLYRNGGVYARQMAAFMLADDPDLIIGFNEPYQVDDQTDWFVIQHAEPKGVPQVLIEVRNDQLRKDVNIDLWAKRLSDACLKMLS